MKFVCEHSPSGPGTLKLSTARFQFVVGGRSRAAVVERSMADDVKEPDVAPDVNFDPGVTSSVVAPSCLPRYASVRPCSRAGPAH